MTTETATEQRVFRIPTWKWPATVKRLERLNKRAAKLGAEPITWSEVGTETRLLNRSITLSPTGMYTYWETAVDAPPSAMGEVIGQREYQLATVTGVAPRLAGWVFRGTLVHVPEVGNILKTIGDGDVPERFREADAWCDHCALVRRRKDTFLVQSESTGEWKQVGRQCLADFLGHQNPEQIASWAEVIATLEDDLDADEDWNGGGGYNADPVVSTRYFLATVAAHIEQNGWLSRTKARETFGEPTADAALKQYNRNIAKTSDRFVTVTEDHERQADEALEWARGLEGDDLDNDFLWNLHVVTAGDYAPERGAGVLAAVFVAQKYGEEREARVERPESNWFGEPKKREEFELEVVFTLVTEGYYSSTLMVKFVDGAGNEAVWFNGSSDWDWEVGDKVRVKATVKAHDEYEGRKQTILTRVAKLEVMERAEQDDE